MNPRRNSIEMDLFPTNLVDNLVIVKTQTSDLPGDWAEPASASRPRTSQEFTLTSSRWDSMTKRHSRMFWRQTWGKPTGWRLTTVSETCPTTQMALQ